MAIPWLRGLGVVGAAVLAATTFAKPALAAAPPTPGIEVDDENGRCTAGFAAQGRDGGYYLMTSGHCDAHDGSDWTYADGVPLGRITASEQDGDKRDAAIIRLGPGVGEPTGDVDGRYPVRDVLGAAQITVGMPFCKVGAVTGETCGAVKSVDGDLVEASVYSLNGDSGSPGFVKNSDGTVSAVGLLMSSPDNDDYTTDFVLVQPLLGRWGLHILP
ncbi:trypsin domain-containing protein [Mycobacterium bohemicum DSM 44277]|uniref:Trypsin n=2 Tax=Mycobacterium bohemicum TaxID=56425 RepID=A0A1X1QYD5_MYCBE|nr:S1 family peptidase [Mycobacterium bohemicum]MCV6971963.1 trypsin [Mycobacterium bohemicum]ORU96417.1 trypsin [Mycobacterium bohemicum]CPR11254.1 trypsin domain-containing protein [Mycobacterium bohemicum DSM 44277]